MKTLREYRRSLDLSQSDFGQRVGVTASMISQIERGERNPPFDLITRICAEFGVNVQIRKDGLYIVNDDEIPTPPLFTCAQAGDEVVIMSESEFTEGQAVSWFYFTYQKEYLLEKFEEGTVGDGHFNYMKFRIASN